MHIETAKRNSRQEWIHNNANHIHTDSDKFDDNQYIPGSPNYNLINQAYRYLQIYGSPQNYYSNFYMKNNTNINDYFQMNHITPIINIMRIMH